MGQNFVIDPALIEGILRVARISVGDTVLEIGPGLGSLTRELANHASSVQAVELDASFVQVLRDELADLSNVVVRQGDIMEMPLPSVTVIVSNVPYSISSPLLVKILESPTWRNAVLTFQKDFAARLIAKPGSKDYGRLTLAARYYAEVVLHGTYPPESFLPSPEVSSQIVELKRREKPAIRMADPETFWQLTRVLFTQRNRLLAKALKTLAKGSSLPKAWSQVLLESAPERLLTRRVRELDLGDFAALSDLVSSRAGVGLG